MTAIGLTAAALLLWGIFTQGDDIIRFFKGQTIVVPSNKEANENLSRLLQDLSGDKASLLELAENSKTRLGWIDKDETRRQFRWFLMMRLVDKGQWEEAVMILPEVESLAPVEGLDRLAQAAWEHQDYELQLRLDRELQDKAVSSADYIPYLLKSIRRTAGTCIRMNQKDEAVKAIARLDVPTVQARLSTPEWAREAAELQMIRADVSEVKEPILQIVRNILEQAKWPVCPATARLMLEEVSNTLRDHPNFSQTALREIESKLIRCRDSMLEYPDKEHRLPQCYMMLGDVRNRLSDYEGCAQALSLASAFADGYGEKTPAMEVQIARLRARANVARGAEGEAMRDYRFLVEHDTDQQEVLQAMSYLATHAEGAEKIDMLSKCWDMYKKNPHLLREGDDSRLNIATELSNYYTQAGDYTNAAQWLAESTQMLVDANPDPATGKAFRARMELALMYRKARNDSVAYARLRSIMREIDQLPEEIRGRLNEADSSLYRSVVREMSRTCLLMGDKDTARVWAKKIKEGLPDKSR